MRFLLFFLFLPIFCFTQNNVSGLILDENDQPIEFANISIREKNDGKLLSGTISELDGSFKLSNNQGGELLLHIQFIGFEEQEIEISGNENLQLDKIYLRETATALEEVVVRAEKKVMERNGDKLVFNIANSTLKSGYDGMEVLAQSPSIWVDSNDNIQMRNETPQVMVNGRLLNMTGDALAAYLRNIPSKDIVSIEIQTTPDVASDANNLGGVININLKKNLLGFNGNINSNLTSFGKQYYMFNPSANLNYGSAKWNVYGNYNFRKRHSVYQATTDIIYKESNDYLLTDRRQIYVSDRHNYRLGFVMNPVKHHEFGAEFFGNTSEYVSDIFGEISLSNNSELIDNGELSGTSDTGNDINNVVANYTWRFDTLGSTVKIVGDGTWQNSTEDNLNVSEYELNVRNLTDNTETNLFNNETSILSVQTDLNKNFLNGFKLNAGGKFSEVVRNNKLTASTTVVVNDVPEIEERPTALEYTEQITAAYLSASKKIKEKHFLKAGIRMENTALEKLDFVAVDTLGQNYTDWFPSAYYSYDVNENKTLSLKYSRRLSRPYFAFLNNNVYKVNDFRYFIGNPDLRPEYIDLYEIEWQQKKHTFSLYYRQSNDAINGVYTLVDSIAYYQKKNDGQQKQLGLEYSSTFEVGQRWTIRGSINAYHRRFTNEGGFDSFKQNTISFRLFNNFKINPTTTAELTFRYMSPTADAFYLQDEFYYVNLMLRKNFFDSKLQCSLYFDDVFNTILWSNTRPFDDIVTSSKENPLTQSVRLSLIFNFDNNRAMSKRKNKSENDVRRRL